MPSFFGWKYGRQDTPVPTIQSTPPAPSAILDSNGLCPGCGDLIRRSSEPPTLRFPAGPRIRYSLAAHECVLCHLLFYTYYGFPPVHARPRFAEIVTFSLLRQMPHSMNIIPGTQRDYRELAGAPGAGDTICIAVRNMMSHPLTLGYASALYEESETMKNVEAFIALCADGDGDPRLDKMQLVDVQDVSENFDPALTITWIEQCRHGHSSSCESSTRPLSEALTLVDCIESQICRRRNAGHECDSRCPGKRLATVNVSPARIEEPGCEYVALSYVWGGTKPAKCQGDEEEPDPRPPGSVMLGPRLDQVADTISDAVEVTTSLGRRYLWVDQYCMDQENLARKKAQIRQMRRIYEKADVVVVAAAGEDANYGLPGVHKRRRTSLPTLRFDRVTVRCVPPVPASTIVSSEWATRGWTYEEAFLSRRRLFFLDDQTYFECGLGHWCERISVSPTSYLGSQPCISLLSLYGSQAKARRSKLINEVNEVNTGEVAAEGRGETERFVDEGLLPYMAAVEEYSTRSLTRPSDSLHAFVGMLEYFQDALETRIYHVWGVPFVADPRISPTDAIRFFATGLAWSHPAASEGDRDCEWEDWIHTTPCPRRSDFPSWSWAAWQGRAEYPHRLLKDVRCSDVSFRDAHTGASSSGLSDIAESNEASGPAVHHPRNLVLHAPMIPPTVFNAADSIHECMRLDEANSGITISTWKREFRGGKYVCMFLGNSGSHGLGLVLARTSGSKRGDPVLYRRVGLIDICGHEDGVRGCDDWEIKAFEIE